MWWSSFDRRRWSHWLLLASVVVILLSYTGLVSWGRLGDALELLAEKPSGAPVFHAKIDRADAIFMVFMFLFLTPLAVVAVGGLVAFVGAVLAGMLESTFHRSSVPDWIFTASVYFVLAVVGYITRDVWFPHAQGLASLIARAMVAAAQ